MPASPSRDEVGATWRHVVLGVARHSASTARHLEGLLDREPGHVPGQCLRGFAQLFKGRRSLRSAALAAAAHARALLDAGGGDPGDAALVDALDAWARDDLVGAEAALRRRLEVLPLDLFTVKLQHGLLFMMGEVGDLRARVEGHLADWPVDDPDRGYVLGATMFARVECDDLEAAEAAFGEWAERPLEDAWGLHAVAHLLHEQGRYGDALAWLDGRRDRWSGCDRFGRHLDWHRALLHLHLGGPRAALAIFDTHLRGVFDGDYRDMSNAVSILWRLEALGIDVGPRWHELAAVSAEFASDHGSAFADAHYVLAQLHGSSPAEADALVASMASVDGEGFQAAVVREVGRPLCAALARWQAAPEDALETLRSVRPELVRLGGSGAQRSLFDDVLAHLEATR